MTLEHLYKKVFKHIPSYNKLSNKTFYESGEWQVLIHELDHDNENDLYFEVRILPIKQGNHKRDFNTYSGCY